jgi:hypothetical protein
LRFGFEMRRPHLLLLIVAALSCAARAVSSEPRPPKPYQPVTITRATAVDDPTFAAFRSALAAAAKSRVYAELATLVNPQGFFWERDFERRFDPRKPAVDNLAAAVALERNGGAGWETLAAFAADATAEPLTSRPGVICSPARPGYDALALSRMLDATYTTDADWAYPLLDRTPVRAAPSADAPQLGDIGKHFVRLIGFESPESKQAVKSWPRIALPDGRLGFVPPGSLAALTSERLCYVKDTLGAWRIAGYVAARN